MRKLLIILSLVFIVGCDCAMEHKQPREYAMEHKQPRECRVTMTTGKVIYAVRIWEGCGSYSYQYVEDGNKFKFYAPEGALVETFEEK